MPDLELGTSMADFYYAINPIITDRILYIEAKFEDGYGNQFCLGVLERANWIQATEVIRL